MVTNQWVFIDNIEGRLQSLKKLGTIEPVYVDILHNLSSRTTGGIMDFPIFADKLYKVNYENLFFLQNHSIIKTLMKLFNAKHSLEFYEKEIRKYNIANMKLKKQLEHALFLVLDKLKNE